MRTRYPSWAMALLLLLTSAMAIADDLASTATLSTGNGYNAAANRLLPLTPAQIRDFRARIDRTREAMYGRTPPDLLTRSRPISIAPGAPVPVIKLSPGFVTTLVFLDQTGAPWPITSYAVGAPKQFNVIEPKIQQGNILTVAALNSHEMSNIAVTLANEATPVILMFRTDDANADAMVALRINRPGPNAVTSAVGPAITTADNPVLMSFLDGIPPEGAVALDSGDAQLAVWRYQHSLYVRTRYGAVWPAWQAVNADPASSVHVYQMPVVSSLILSVDGKTRTFDLTQPGLSAKGADHGG